VPEWPNGEVSKTFDDANRPRVRIPPSPPFLCIKNIQTVPQKTLRHFLNSYNEKISNLITEIRYKVTYNIL
jgi:hypothetical protein